MKSIKKKVILRKLAKIGSDFQKIQHLSSVLKKAGFLTGFATFAGGIATGGVGIAVVTIGLAGLALSKLLSKKKGNHHQEHDLTTEQKEVLTSLLEKLMKDHANDSAQNCEKIDEKLTDKEIEQIRTILGLLKHDKNNSSPSSSDVDIDDLNDDDSTDKKNEKKDDDKNKNNDNEMNNNKEINNDKDKQKNDDKDKQKKDDKDKQKKDDKDKQKKDDKDIELLDVILTLLKNKEKHKI